MMAIAPASFVWAMLAASAAAAPAPDAKPQTTEGLELRWLRTVLSVEVPVEGGHRVIGTGFLVSTPGRHSILVTAKHVAFQNGSQVPNLKYRVALKAGGSKLIPDDSLQQRFGRWFKSDRHDVACRFMPVPADSDIEHLDYSVLLPMRSLRAGAPIVIAGYPFGLRTEGIPLPLLRRGILSSLVGDRPLIDAQLFPGNSGGPVFYVPTVKVAPPLEAPFINSNQVVGLISEGILRTVTVSPQARVSSEVGLTYIEPVDHILELLDSQDVKNADEALK